MCTIECVYTSHTHIQGSANFRNGRSVHTKAHTLAHSNRHTIVRVRKFHPHINPVVVTSTIRIHRLRAACVRSIHKPIYTYIYYWLAQKLSAHNWSFVKFNPKRHLHTYTEQTTLFYVSQQCACLHGFPNVLETLTIATIFGK